MPRINLLPRDVFELISAGEVVERPASAVKEAVENSIDAKSKHITVEIRRGGISYIRITDDGCGIDREDVPLAFVSHATSKIKDADDLDAISSLGFRGEALAAAGSVSRVEMFTRTESEETGTHYIIEGGTEIIFDECGAEKGTTLIIRDLFYNTPARMKFLKKDFSEGNAVAAVMQRAALSHPEIAFKFIRESKTEFITSGNGDLKAAIYSVLGREFASSLITVNSEVNGISVSGYVCKPVFCRQSRAGQYTFLNGRFVRSGTVCAAVEQAYKNSSMTGKFPSFVLSLSVPFSSVDVNVHPAKTEVRFSDEKRIFDAVYSSVKASIFTNDTRPQMNIGGIKKAIPSPDTVSEEKFVQTSAPMRFEKKEEPKKPELSEIKPSVLKFKQDSTPFFLRDDIVIPERKEIKVNPPEIKKEPKIKMPAAEVRPKEEPKEEPLKAPAAEVRLIGEAFRTYIIVEKGESVFMIDKHAAHERIIFNELVKNIAVSSQALLEPRSVTLEPAVYSAVCENLDEFEKAGFEIEDFGNLSVVVRAVPSVLRREDVAETVIEAARLFMSGGTAVSNDLKEDILHTVACKAAIKANFVTPPEEMLSLAKKVLSDREVFYCPHGRPVAFELSKRDLERQFKRIQ